MKLNTPQTKATRTYTNPKQKYSGFAHKQTLGRQLANIPHYLQMETALLNKMS